MAMPELELRQILPKPEASIGVQCLGVLCTLNLHATLTRAVSFLVAPSFIIGLISLIGKIVIALGCLPWKVLQLSGLQNIPLV